MYADSKVIIGKCAVKTLCLYALLFFFICMRELNYKDPRTSPNFSNFFQHIAGLWTTVYAQRT